MHRLREFAVRRSTAGRLVGDCGRVCHVPSDLVTVHSQRHVSRLDHVGSAYTDRSHFQRSTARLSVIPRTQLAVQATAACQRCEFLSR